MKICRTTDDHTHSNHRKYNMEKFVLKYALYFKIDRREK